jgi:hypothetical protein
MASFPAAHWNHCPGAIRDERTRPTEKGSDRKAPLGRGLRSGSDVGASRRTVAARGGTAAWAAPRTDRYARTAMVRPPGDASSSNRRVSRYPREISRKLTGAAASRSPCPDCRAAIPNGQTASAQLSHARNRLRCRPESVRFDAWYPSKALRSGFETMGGMLPAASRGIAASTANRCRCIGVTPIGPQAAG